MSQIRRFAVAGLTEAVRRGKRHRGLVIGRSTRPGRKAGEATAGVKCQYMECEGRVANVINAVQLSYVREKTGRAGDPPLSAHRGLQRAKDTS